MIKSHSRSCFRLQEKEMAKEINVEIITREAIKPSSPTPNDLRNFNLSLLDQLAPVAYEPLVLIYPPFHFEQHLTVTGISRRLKRSLSDTLTRFHPLAGRIKDDTSSIECNDLGAVYAEARVSCLLSKFLERPDAAVIRKFIPIEIESPEALTGSLVLVQANFFACGGLAIGVCISHKVADPVTFCTFIKAWAAAALRCGDEAVLPVFNASSVFPPQINFSLTKTAIKSKADKCVTKRLVFDASKIAVLKAKAASESVTCPTRVEAVTALIWKSAMNASRSNSEHSRFSILAQSVNLRKSMVPPLPENTMGNLVGYFASCATECDQIELQSLVRQLRKGMQDFGENYVKKLKEDKAVMAICESFEEAGIMLQEGNMDFYINTSFCRFPFYGIDFGWGKPTWVTIPTGAYKNVSSIMDSRDGKGIEAWVSLTEEDMVFFERDQELLAAAALDPSALIPPPMSCL